MLYLKYLLFIFGFMKKNRKFRCDKQKVVARVDLMIIAVIFLILLHSPERNPACAVAK